MSNNRKICLGDIELTQSSEVEALNSRVSTIEGITPLGKAINTTWVNLKSLRDNSQLVPGQFYRITDYQCTTTQENTQSAGHQFDIIVRADDVNVLNENAYATLHEGDTYFANSKLEAWKLRYTVDNINWSPETVEYITFTYQGTQKADYSGTKVINNTEYYKWYGGTYFGYFCTLTKTVGDSVCYGNGNPIGSTVVIESYVYQEGGKGTILRMIDEFNNDVPYDFKNIQYVKKMGFIAYGQYGSSYTSTYERYEANDTTVSDTLYYGFKRISFIPGPPPMDEYVWTTTTVLTTSMSLYKISGGNVSSVTGTITNVNTLSFNTYTFDNNGSDASINGSSQNVTENSIASYVEGNKQTLNVIYFRTSSTGSILSAYGNSFKGNCHDISFSSGCTGNTFGTNNYSNSFGNNCSNNSFGNYYYSNTFGSGCSNNSFGNYCYKNSFGTSCQYNSFGNYYYSNSFGTSCQYNSFGNNCSNNTFGNYCSNNSFGISCNSNSFGNFCIHNSLGNYCIHNSLENYCNDNSFGNFCQYNSFSKSYYRYIIFENGNCYITLTSTQTTSSSNQLQNIKICQGVNNTITMKTISHDTVNDTFQTVYKAFNSQVLHPYNAVDLGLPSGTKWADRNVGADNPEDPGLYFQWGDNEGFSKDSGKYCNGTRVEERNWTGDYSATHGCMLGDEQNIPVDPYFDAARKHMGAPWRIPTKQEIQELFNNSYTTYQWTTRNGMNGYLITSKSNGNSIFLPAAGYFNEGFRSFGGNGGYWSSLFIGGEKAYSLYFNNGIVIPDSNSDRYSGFSVRAVQ